MKLAKLSTLAVVASLLTLPAAFAADTTSATAATKPATTVAKKKVAHKACHKVKKCSKVTKAK